MENKARLVLRDSKAFRGFKGPLDRLGLKVKLEP
jgi:hypothetical protein